MPTDMQTLITFAKTKGFVYQGSEICIDLTISWIYTLNIAEEFSLHKN